MNTGDLTGRFRFRTQKRFLRAPQTVLQCEVVCGYSYYGLMRLTGWRDVTSADLLQIEVRKRQEGKS